MFRLVKFLLTAVLWIVILLFIAYCALCILFPVKYADQILKYSEKYDLEPVLVCAIINTEIVFDPAA